MKTRALLLAVLILGTTLLGACVPAGTPTVQALPTEEVASGTPVMALATPYADQPTAGICGGPLPDELVTVTIWPDIPDPRCLQVAPGQRLQVSNGTDSELLIKLGAFEERLPQGESLTIDMPVGLYLAPGVHLVGASPYSGPEVWLQE